MRVNQHFTEEGSQIQSLFETTETLKNTNKLKLDKRFKTIDCFKACL